jgi:hypothetical protein
MDHGGLVKLCQLHIPKVALCTIELFPVSSFFLIVRRQVSLSDGRIMDKVIQDIVGSIQLFASSVGSFRWGRFGSIAIVGLQKGGIGHYEAAPFGWFRGRVQYRNVPRELRKSKILVVVACSTTVRKLVCWPMGTK